MFSQNRWAEQKSHSIRPQRVQNEDSSILDFRDDAASTVRNDAATVLEAGSLAEPSQNDLVCLRRNMRRRIWLRRSFRLAFEWKLLVVDRKARSDPEGIDDVVPTRIGSVGMNEDAQATMVEHEPRHQCGEDVIGKGDLEHGPVTRTDPCIMPAAELYRKAFADPRA